MGRRRAGTYLGVLIVAGVLTSVVAELLLCLWTAVRSPSLTVAFLASIAYVFAAVLSGVAATWLVWSPSRMNPPLSFRFFALTGALGWIWIPSVVLLSRRGSIGAALLGVMGAAIMASGLKRILVSDAGPIDQNSPGWKTEGRELFAQSLLTRRGMNTLWSLHSASTPRSMHGRNTRLLLPASCWLCAHSYWHGN